MTLHGPHVFVEIWTAMRPSLPPVTRSHSALLLANFTFPSPPSALIRNRRRFCLLFFYEERRKKRARERSRKTPAIRSFFYATSMCTNARASNPNEGMLSHIPSKVHAKYDTIMSVPELFSTISRLSKHSPRAHRKSNTLVRSSRPPSRKTQSSFVKSEDDFIKESASSFKKTSSSSSTMCLSHLLFLKVRPSDDGAKKEIELDVVAALRIASILLLFLRATCTVTRV